MNVMPGLLPPIKHRLTTAVQNFPVIPPIAGGVKTPGSRSQSRGQGDEEDREELSAGDTAGTRETVKRRNSHLLKVSSALRETLRFQADKQVKS